MLKKQGSDLMVLNFLTFKTKIFYRSSDIFLQTKTNKMKRTACIFISICLLACSPYKKVTLTLSDRLTTRWKGTEEKLVLEAMGAYSTKIPKPDGYALRYDY